MIRTALLALACALLTACGAMETATGIPDPFGTPQPFQGTGDQVIVGEALLERSVYVGPIEGLDEAAAASLRKAIADAAGALDVLASATTPPAQSLTLTGRARGEAVDFTLFDQQKALTTFTASGDPSLVAINTAQSLAIALGRLGAAPSAVAGVPGAQGATAAPTRVPTIFVSTISGPEKQTAPLRRAIVSGLTELNAIMVEAPTEGAYVVTGVLGFGPDQQGQMGVSIIWRVQAPDGQELGSAEQDNVLPTKAVQERWAEQAALAGGAAATSVAQIIAADFNKKPTGS